MITYDAFALYLLDDDGDWCDIDVSFNEDALEDTACRIAANNPERYPSGSYRLDKVKLVTVEHGELCNVEDEDF